VTAAKRGEDNFRIADNTGVSGASQVEVKGTAALSTWYGAASPRNYAPKSARLGLLEIFAMSVNSSSSIVRFGTFEINLQTGELRHAGQKVKLQEQPFQVLAALLERSGEVVTREELRNKLWPEDTFVDFDHSLNAAIKRLRDALAESADTPVFIETLARRGYRFIAPVNRSSAPSDIEVAPEPARNKSFFVTHRIAIAYAAPIVVVALVFAAWRFPLRHTDIIERKITSNSSENSVSSAAVSPDGKYVAYTDNTGLYLKLTRTGEVHALPLPLNFSALVDDWFPDGSYLLVSRQEEPRKASLWSISLFGGSPRPLADDASGGSVSPDGARIAFQRLGFGREEWVMRSDGTDQVKVAGDKTSWVGSPTWSPDGKRIAYVRSTWDDNAPGSFVEVNDWMNAKAETIFSDGSLGPSLRWLRDGRLIYALADANNQKDASLWVVSLQPSGKIAESPKRITRGTSWISQITGNGDGKVVTYLRGKSVPSVYVAVLAPDGAHLLDSKRLTLDESANKPFSWTVDGKAVLFSSDRNGTPEIFRQNTDQALAEIMLTSAEYVEQPRVTPDGSEILYISRPKSADPETPASIFAIPIAGGAPRSILKDVHIWNMQCARLPSTMCLYSITKGDISETFRFDVRSGKSSAPPQVDPFGNWSLSPDGSQRAILPGRHNGTIRLRSTLTGETRELPVKGWNELGAIDWSADGRSLLVSWENYERDSALLRITLDGRVSVLLRSRNGIRSSRAESGRGIWGAIPSPDGKSLAIAGVASNQNAWQVENF